MYLKTICSENETLLLLITFEMIKYHDEKNNDLKQV